MSRAKGTGQLRWRSEARSRPDLAPVLRALGHRVRGLRHALDLTQEELARKAQLDAKHVQTIEAGNSNVTVSTLLGLSEALGCTIADLFMGK